jgi:hypothetical protein
VYGGHTQCDGAQEEIVKKKVSDGADGSAASKAHEQRKSVLRARGRGGQAARTR